MHVVEAAGLRVDRLTVPDGTVRVNTWYAGHLSDAVEPGAQAFSVGMETPFTNLRAHFHDVAQFQVFVDGNGWLGSREIGPCTVFYTDAFTSYGPIKAGADGLTFFTLRCEHDAGVRWMPEQRALRQPTSGRRLVFEFDPADPANQAIACTPGKLRRDLAAAHEDGMRVEFVVAGPRTTLAPIFAETAPRQYALVLAGEMTADGKQLRRRSLLYNEDQAQPSNVATAESGVMVAVMTFPGGGQPTVH
jgi:hypothetical protein